MVRSGLSSQSSGGFVGRLEAVEDGGWTGLETLERKEFEEGELEDVVEAESEGRSEYPFSFAACGEICEAKFRKCL